jgi:hypothetical protein
MELTAPLGEEIAVVKMSIEDLPSAVLPFTLTLIRHGDDPDNPIGTEHSTYPSRSEPVFRVACDLVKAGCSDAQIVGILSNEVYGISTSVLEKKNSTKYARRQVASARQAVEGGWPDVTKQGNPRATMRNAIVALTRLGLTFEFDMFHLRKRVCGHALQEFQGDLSDDACILLRKFILDEFGFDPFMENVRDAINTLCLEQAYHPIRIYLDSLVWDGKPRIASWLTVYLGAPDTELNRAIARIVLVAAVRRIRCPGTKYDVILVLEGLQGSGKSTAIVILAGEQNFSDQDILTLDSKAQMEAVEGVWIYELGELEGLTRADTSRTKAFASRNADRGRPAYGRFKDIRPRQCIFIGTTNDDKYLKDQTGNRRFWPVVTTLIDLKALRRDRDQLWAEAAYWEAKDESVVLPKELWPAAQAEQAARMGDDPWLELLAGLTGDVANGIERVTTQKILTHLEIGKERQNQFHAKRIAPLMRQLGWDGPKRLRLADGRVTRGYERPAAESKNRSS